MICPICNGWMEPIRWENGSLSFPTRWVCQNRKCLLRTKEDYQGDE